MRAPTEIDETVQGDRRKGDRRKTQLPFEGANRRKGERRSGDDRRCNPRIDTD